MAQWAVKQMAGMIPKDDSRLLPPNNADQAVNCDLAMGVLDGLPTPNLVKDLTAISTAVKKAYRFPDPTGAGGSDAWLPLPSPYCKAELSPLTNDSFYRIYYTVPVPAGGSPGPTNGAFFTTYANILSSTAPYNLGYIAPTVTPTVAASGGTSPTIVPYVSRSYCYTWIDAFGNESSPSLPSTVVNGASDGTWAITLPTSFPSNSGGYNYPIPNKMRLYRTVSGATTGAQFYQVADFTGGTFPPSSPYIDTTLDTTIINNLVLPSANWNNCPAGLDGLIALPGSFFCGFIGNTIYFSEPGHPHSWPAGYQLSVLYPIQEMAIWQQALIVLTQGIPYQGSGSTPSAFTFAKLNVPEPCLSRGSVVTDLLGVYYASQNGLVYLNYFGMQNATLTVMTKNIWEQVYDAASIIACRHRTQYLAINGSSQGFLIDYTTPTQGVVLLSTLNNVDCIWNDVYTGDTYCISGKIVYRYDDGTTQGLTYRWRSKKFYLPSPANLGACQIHTSPDLLTVTAPGSPPPMTNSDSTLTLPGGVNATFKLWADGKLVLTRNILVTQDIFRLPSGFMAYEWQFEIVSRVPIYSVELASTMLELKGV